MRCLGCDAGRFAVSRCSLLCGLSQWILHASAPGGVQLLKLLSLLARLIQEKAVVVVVAC